MTVVNLRRPVVVDGEVKGVLASTITVQALSEFITGLETELGQNAFVLYERELVLAHSTLALDFPDLGAGAAAAARHRDRRSGAVRDLARGLAGAPAAGRRAGPLASARRRRVPLPLPQSRAADRPRAGWSAATSPAEAVDIQLERLLLALGLGLLAPGRGRRRRRVLLGRRVSRPIAQLAAAASAIRTLDLDDLAPLRRSRLREIDQAAIAFNAMVRALARVRGLCAASRSCRA